MFMNIFKPIPFLLIGFSLVTSAYAGDVKVTVASEVPFSESSSVREAVKTECNLQTKLPQFIAEYANEYGVEVTLEEKPNKKKGSYLWLEITQVHASGGGAWSGPKSVSVAGTLFKEGKQESQFTATRYSTGGFFGAYKGTCSIAGRCVKTLGSDIAKWLKKPKNKAHLGDG